MAINQMLHTTELCNQIIKIISDAHKSGVVGGLGLNMYQYGGVEYFATPSASVLSDNVPAVFVKPIEIDPKFKELGESYEMLYRFRIVFVNKFVKTDTVVKDKIDATRKIAELFFDDITLGSLALTNGAIDWILIDKIEFEPPEDDFVLLSGSKLYAVALNLMINVLTNS